jgi:hypothetical protein
LPAVERYGPSNQNGLRIIDAGCHDIEHVVHPVNQVHIRMTGRSEHDFGPFRPPLRSVARQIVSADVGFCFYDPRTQFPAANAADEHRPDQVAGQLDRGAVEKGVGEFSLRHRTLTLRNDEDARNPLIHL